MTYFKVDNEALLTGHVWWIRARMWESFSTVGTGEWFLSAMNSNMLFEMMLKSIINSYWKFRCIWEILMITLNLKALKHSGHLNFRKTWLSSWLSIWRCRRYTLAKLLLHSWQDWSKDAHMQSRDRSKAKVKGTSLNIKHAFINGSSVNFFSVDQKMGLKY
jgi:hypothetical protein